MTQSDTHEAEGMTRASCAGRVERAARAAPGEKAAVPTLAAKRSHPEAGGASESAIPAADVQKAGFSIGAAVTAPNVDTITCASRMVRIERPGAARHEATGAALNLATGSALVHPLAGARDANRTRCRRGTGRQCRHADAQCGHRAGCPIPADPAGEGGR